MSEWKLDEPQEEPQKKQSPKDYTDEDILEDLEIEVRDPKEYAAKTVKDEFGFEVKTPSVQSPPPTSAGEAGADDDIDFVSNAIKGISLEAGVEFLDLALSKAAANYAGDDEKQYQADKRSKQAILRAAKEVMPKKRLPMSPMLLLVATILFVYGSIMYKAFKNREVNLRAKAEKERMQAQLDEKCNEVELLKKQVEIEIEKQKLAKVTVNTVVNEVINTSPEA